MLFQKYSVSLPARKRQKNESLTKLADDIRHMSDIVYYDLQQDQKERLATMHFTNALQNPIAQYDISQKAPKTLEEALHIASIREMFFSVESQSGKTYTSSKQNMPIDVRSINTANQFQCQKTNQWTAQINNAANWSHPE